jgi:hypothetical protein
MNLRPIFATTFALSFSRARPDTSRHNVVANRQGCHKEKCREALCSRLLLTYDKLAL